MIVFRYSDSNAIFMRPLETRTRSDSAGLCVPRNYRSEIESDLLLTHCSQMICDNSQRYSDLSLTETKPKSSFLYSGNPCRPISLIATSATTIYPFFLYGNMFGPLNVQCPRKASSLRGGFCSKRSGIPFPSKKLSRKCN